MHSIIELSFILAVYTVRSKINNVKIFIRMVQLLQALTQATQIGLSDLFILPHVTDLKQFASKNVKSIADLKNNLKMLDSFELSQKEDIKLAISYIPDLKIDVIPYVFDEKDFFYGDIVTVKIVINRLNLQENHRVGPIHSALQFQKVEKYYVIISNSKTDEVHYVRSLSSSDKLVIHEGFRFKAESNFSSFENSEVYLEIRIISDSYPHVNYTFPLKIHIQPAPVNESYSDEDSN